MSIQNQVLLVGSVRTTDKGITRRTTREGVSVASNITLWKRDEDNRVMYTMPIKTFSRTIADTLESHCGDGKTELALAGNIRTEYWTGSDNKLNSRTFFVVEQVEDLQASEVDNFQKREYNPS